MKNLSTYAWAVMLLAGLTLLFGGALFCAYKFNMAEGFKATMGNTFAGFSGALLLALKSEAKVPNGNTENGSPKQ